MRTIQHFTGACYVSVLFLVFLFNSCVSQVENEMRDSSENIIKVKSLIDTTKTVFTERFSVPDGYERINLESNSFGHYLRELNLKPHGSKVKFYDGRFKTKTNVYCAVIDQDIDKVDLQQCADAVMRLRGEYLYSQKKYSLIHFNFVSDRKPHYYHEYAKGDYSYKKFRAYMRYIFSYANTASLKNELIPVSEPTEIEPGDVFIQSGNPYGHAVIVMDVAVNPEGKKIFMLAQSYMPAQETQILINPADADLSPWYEITSGELRTPEWTFDFSDLRRFKDE